jgi:hypothetical protein
MPWGRRSGDFGPQILEPAKVGGGYSGSLIGISLPMIVVGLIAGLAVTSANAQTRELGALTDSLNPITKTNPATITAAQLQQLLLEVCKTTPTAAGCAPGGISISVPEVPGDIQKILGGVERLDALGLLYRSAAVLSQVANNVASVASGLTQDVVSGVLDVALEPEAAAVLGPFGASNGGAASSMFMISGYKHLSHDGYSVSSSFGPATGKGPEFEEDNYGLTLGTRFDGSGIFGTEKGSVTFGVLANYTHTDIETGVAGANLPGVFKSGSASIDSWSIGGYGMVTDGHRYGLVTVNGTFGSPETDNPIAATADYGTFGFAASAVTGVLVPLGGAKLDLRGGLNYLHASSDDYTDSLGSHYTDARMEEFSGSLSARLFGVVRVDEYNVRPFVQGGINHRFYYENEITVDNATFAFDDADTSIFARAGIDFDINKSVLAYLAVRGDASEDMRAIAAQLGVTFKLD